DSNEALREEAQKLGFAGIMVKPLRAADMATTLLEALSFNPRDTSATAARRRQILLRLCLKGKHVMIVDHNFISRKAVAVMLSRFADVALALGSASDALARLHAAPSLALSQGQGQGEGQGEGQGQALRQIRGAEFHLVLVNLRLADMSGYDWLADVSGCDWLADMPGYDLVAASLQQQFCCSVLLYQHFPSARLPQIFA
ncbi:unnamed protein product, partial [Closterium sp. NIES-53]